MVSVNSIKFPWDNENHVVRYCASRLSIPDNVISADAIYVGNKSTNDNANIEYGYTYTIHKTNNIHPIKKFELEINHYKYMDKDFLSSYLEFTGHYNDEIFPPEQIVPDEPDDVVYDFFGIDFSPSDISSDDDKHTLKDKIDTDDCAAADSNCDDSEWHIVGKKKDIY